MSGVADVVIYGSPVDKFEDRKFVNKYQEGILADFCTITKFKVKSVIKNSTGLNIGKGDLFDVIEPLTFIDDEHGKRMLELVGYKAMVQKVKYVVYLKNNGQGGYGVINMSNGKFNMDNDSEDDDYTHISMKKEILDRYSKELSN